MYCDSRLYFFQHRSLNPSIHPPNSFSSLAPRIFVLSNFLSPLILFFLSNLGSLSQKSNLKHHSSGCYCYLVYLPTHYRYCYHKLSITKDSILPRFFFRILQYFNSNPIHILFYPFDYLSVSASPFILLVGLLRLGFVLFALVPSF
jgi:hypothetical protein